MALHKDWRGRVETLLAEARSLGVGDSARKLELIAEARALRSEREGITYAIPREERRYREGPGRIPRVPVRRGPPQRCKAGASCEGSGWILRGDDQVASPCRCREHSTLRSTRYLRDYFRPNLTLSLDAPPLANMATATHQAAREVRESIVAKAGVGAWLLGPSGSGKTSLAAWLAAEVASAGLSVAYLELGHLFRWLRWHDSTGVRQARSLDREVEMGRVARDLLVIDDLDATLITWPGQEESEAKNGGEARPPERFRGRDLDRLRLILDERSMHERATIVTSSLTPAALAQRFTRVGPYDLMLELIQAARSDDTLTSEDARVEFRAESIIGRLREMCGEPIPMTLA